MLALLVIQLLAFALCVAAGGDAPKDIRVVLPVEHALSPGQFTSRGELELVVSPANKKIVVKFLSPTLELSSDERAQFSQLVKDGEFYTVRVPVDAKSPDSPHIVASISPCSLWNDDFNEMFHFHVDKAGSIVGFEFSRFQGTSICPADAALPEVVKLNTMAMASLPSQGMVIPKGAFGQKPKQVPGMPTDAQVSNSDAPKKDGEKQPPQPQDAFGLLKKYWYIALPIAIALIMPAEQPEAPPAGKPASKASGKAVRSKRSRG